MKKKLLLVCMSIGLAIGVIGCGSDNKTEDSTNKTNTQNEVETVVDLEDIVPEEKENWSNELLTKSPEGSKIFFKYPEDYYYNDERWGYYISEKRVYDDYIVVVQGTSHKDFEGNSEDAIEFLKDAVLSVFDSVVSMFDFNYLNIVSSESLTVNGYDATKFVAETDMKTFEEGEEYVCYVYGYTLVIEDTPICVAGVVTTEEQEQDLIDKMVNLVDDISNTIYIE